MLVAPHPAPQLVELGKPELVGTVHNNRVGRRNIQSAFNNGRAQEQIDFPVYEFLHDIFQLFLGQLSVGDTHANFRNDFAGIGLPVREQIPSGTAPDPWLVYLHVLTLDFRIRDNYKKSTSNYIKIISRIFNDEKKIRCLINLGVNGIVTDKPERLRQIALDMGKKVD